MARGKVGVAFCGFSLPQPRARRRFQPAFLHVGGSVDDLQIRHAPIDQQCRPGSLCPLAAPDLEQRHAVIDFRVLGEPRAGESATKADLLRGIDMRERPALMCASAQSRLLSRSKLLLGILVR